MPADSTSFINTQLLQGGWNLTLASAGYQYVPFVQQLLDMYCYTVDFSELGYYLDASF